MSVSLDVGSNIISLQTSIADHPKLFPIPVSFHYMLFRIFQVQVYISKKLIILFCRMLLSCCHQVTALCLDTRQPAILIHMHCYLAMIQNLIVIMTCSRHPSKRNKANSFKLSQPLTYIDVK